jgi:hypothetical protein
MPRLWYVLGPASKGNNRDASSNLASRGKFKRAANKMFIFSELVAFFLGGLYVMFGIALCWLAVEIFRRGCNAYLGLMKRMMNDWEERK